MKTNRPTFQSTYTRQSRVRLLFTLILNLGVILALGFSSMSCTAEIGGSGSGVDAGVRGDAGQGAQCLRDEDCDLENMEYCIQGFCELPYSCFDDFDCFAQEACIAGICQYSGNTSTCTVAECSSGSALACDGSLSLECGDFGGSCERYQTLDNVEFGWCGCGEIPEGQSYCASAQDILSCEDGFAQPYFCPYGSDCLDERDGYEAGCYCDEIFDGICPDPVCTNDPDCQSCAPDCSGAECGDNGCGGICGNCNLGESCMSGSCETSACVPSCGSRVCGPNGCGGTCGSCPGSEACSNGECTGVCVPDCTGRECGRDGCGGTCGGDGSCPAAHVCNSTGLCVSDSACTPQCDFVSNVCGDDGCGGSCGFCSGGQTCEDSRCTAANCGSLPACEAPSTCGGVSSGGSRCTCPGEFETYSFDGSSLDFTGVLKAAKVKVRQIYDSESSTPSIRNSGSFRSTPNASLTFSACRQEIEVTRTYNYVIGGQPSTCTIGPELYTGQTNFNVTTPTNPGSNCQVPRM